MKMKAAFLIGKGKIEVRETDKPQIESPDDVLIKIKSVGVCGSDRHYFIDGRIGSQVVKDPHILGHECAGIIEEAGDAVSRVNVGDRVAVEPAIVCGNCYFCVRGQSNFCEELKFLGIPDELEGCMAEYLVMPERNVVPLHPKLSFEDGAMLEPLAICVYAARLCGVSGGDTVAVLGSGPIGLLTTACCKLAGASRIIATGRRNRKRLELAKEMGAEMTICQADVPDENDRRQFVFDNSLNLVGADVVINTVGTAPAFQECIGFVRNSGTLVEVGNFVDSGTIPFNPCRDLLEKGIRIIGSFDNEAEHFVRSLPLIGDPRIPLEKVITHRVPLGDVERSLAAIGKGQKLDGEEIVKIMMDPTLPEKE